MIQTSTLPPHPIVHCLVDSGLLVYLPHTYLRNYLQPFTIWEPFKGGPMRINITLIAPLHIPAAPVTFSWTIYYNFRIDSFDKWSF